MRSRRLLTAAIVALLAVGCGVVVAVTDVLRRAELQTVDARFSVRGEQPEPDGVVFVAIDEPSLDAISDWPFPRGFHGDLIDRLLEADARVIAFDVEFNQASEPAEDAALRQAARRAGDRLVLASATIVDDRPTVAIGTEEFRAPGVAKGDVGYRTDPGGYYRRVGMIDGAPHFVTEAVRLAGRPVPEEAKGDPGQWIDYVGDAGRVKRFSYVDVLDGKVPREELEGKVVVVGPSATPPRGGRSRCWSSRASPRPWPPPSPPSAGRFSPGSSSASARWPACCSSASSRSTRAPWSNCSPP